MEVVEVVCTGNHMRLIFQIIPIRKRIDELLKKQYIASTHPIYKIFTFFIVINQPLK